MVTDSRRARIIKNIAKRRRRDAFPLVEHGYVDRAIQDGRLAIVDEIQNSSFDWQKWLEDQQWQK